MGLSNDLVSQFVKITKDRDNIKKESIVYGEAVKVNNTMFVRIDGSDRLTPISTTADILDGERVTVMIKNHTATVTGNITSPAARVDTVKGINNDVIQIKEVLSDKVTTAELNAKTAIIETLESDNVTVKETLNAHAANIEQLEATIVDADALDAKYATIENLKATNAIVDNLDSIYAKITDLNAAKGLISVLESDVADIDTLIFGSATGNTIQTSFSNAVIAQLGDAQIKSAMIDNISAGKITSGDIITNNVQVKSEDGKLIISDETMQISDSNRVRVQIGKDAANDYSINIWDQNGNLMFSKGGITDSAIKEAIIRNDMVSDTANIAAHKLDIDSLFEEINGSTNTIKSTRVFLDDENQTLDVAFKNLETEVIEQGESITSQGTAISAIQGQISSKVWQQDINTAKNEMSTQYSTLEQNLSGFQASVSETYATQADLDGIEVGGRNLVTGTSDEWTDITVPRHAATVGGRKHCSEYGLKVGDKLTYSLELNPLEKTALRARLDFYSSIGGEDGKIANFGNDISNGQPGKSYLTVTIPEGSEYIALMIANKYADNETTSTTEQYRKVKLEKGNRSTDWTPAPEDMATASNVGAIDERLVSAESSITQLSNKITANVTETTSLGTRMSTVEQTASGLTARLNTAEADIDTAQSTANTAKTNAATAQSTANTAKTNAATAQTTADNAAKTATNYLNYSNGGLVVGNMTSSTLGKNVLIDSDSVDIRNGATTMASFGASTVTLGRNAEDSVIDLCDGAGKISANTAEAATSYPNRNAILIESQEIETESVRFVASTSNKYGASSTPSIVRGTELYMQRSSSSAESCARLKAEHKTTSSGAYTNAGVSAMTYDAGSTTRLLVYASDSANSTYNNVNVYPTKTTMNKNLVLNGTTFTGKNKVLWSGVYYMSDSQTATLSEAITSQANGVVLIWSYYTDGAADNSNFQMTYIPKHFITLHPGKGVAAVLTNGTMNVMASKYVYVSDTSIKGYAGNDDAATAKDSGVTSTAKNFVLRYVIGV